MQDFIDKHHNLNLIDPTRNDGSLIGLLFSDGDLIYTKGGYLFGNRSFITIRFASPHSHDLKWPYAYGNWPCAVMTCADAETAHEMLYQKDQV